MSSGTSSGESAPQGAHDSAYRERPDWADGLRQLYDSVVDEPLPDAFKDLIDKLDDSASADHGEDSAESPDEGAD